jgi:hypothetical protein
VHLRGVELGNPAPFERQSGFAREPKPPVQRSRKSRNHRVAFERADTVPVIERGPTTRLRRTTAVETVLVHRTD